jgi:hypothetical protein
MSKFYKGRSEGYFRPSEFFVNRREYDRERSPYPIDWGNVGRRHSVKKVRNEELAAGCCGKAEDESGYRGGERERARSSVVELRFDAH